MTSLNGPQRAVLRGARFSLAHTPGLVEHGSKPSRELAKAPNLLPSIRGRLRSFEQAAAYPPHRVLLGDMHPKDLWDIERPWYESNAVGAMSGPHGSLMSEEEFYALLKDCDSFKLVSDHLDGPPKDALPLHLRDGRFHGYIASGHSEDDASLTADVLLENLACKATAVAALRALAPRPAGRT